jgi:hypothetical protein
MNAKPLTSQQIQRARDIESLLKLWVSGMPTIPPPPVSQFELWFQIHSGDFGTLAYGLQECLRLYNQRRGVMDLDHAVRHSSRVMNCYSRDRARRKKSSEHWPLNYLTTDWANELGLPPGLALTEDMYWRCAARLSAIQAARVPRPNAAVQSNGVVQN